MIYIYLDSNIFRSLKKASGVNDLLALELLKSKDHSFLPVYSYAHIVDLKRDQTNKKYDDLKFMASISSDRYLCYYKEYENNIFHNQSPIDSFEEQKDEEAFNFDLQADLENTFSDGPLGDSLKVLKSLLDTKVPFTGNVMRNYLPKEDIEMMDLMFGFNEKGTAQDMIEGLANYSARMLNSRKEYLQLRKYLSESFDVNRVTDPKSLNFENELLESDLKKTFSDFVLQSFNGKNRNEISDYSYFTVAYSCLDILGLSPEKIKGNNKLTNLFTDVLHAYYGAHTDFFVVNDIGLLKKAQILYNLLDIQTKVGTLEFFCDYSKLFGNKTPATIQQFFKAMSYDIDKGIRTQFYNSFGNTRTTEVIKCISSYFDFFNQLKVITEGGKTNIVLERALVNYRNCIYWEELEDIIDRVMGLFGMDDNYIGAFNEDDKEKIQTNLWQGRKWTTLDAMIVLEINPSSKTLCLWKMNN